MRKYVVTCLNLGLLVFFVSHCSKETTPPAMKVVEELNVAYVDIVVGDAALLKAGGQEWQNMKVGMKVYSKDIVRTKLESSVHLKISGRANMVVSENSLISMEFQALADSTKYSILDIKAGMVLTSIKKLTGGRDQFLVRTPTAVAAIRGTSFSTVVDQKTGKSEVSVLRGKVAVKKRTFKKVVEGKLISDAVREKRVVQNIDLDNAAQAAAVMDDIRMDYGMQVAKEAAQKRVDAEQKAAQLAKEQGLAQKELEARIDKAIAEIDKQVDEMLGFQEEVMVDRGKIVEVEEAQLELEEPEEITSDELDNLKESFSEDAIQVALLTAPATAFAIREKDVPAPEPEVVAEEKKTNAPPSVTSEPVVLAYSGNPYQYLLAAADPDKDDITFQLEEGPVGMNVSPFSGKVTWNPGEAGTQHVKVKVDDLQGGVAYHEFDLQVRQGLGGELQVRPSIGEANTKFAFNAQSIGTGAGQEGFQYRWDLDGDGTWDLPKEGYTKQGKIQHTYESMGSYKPRVEVAITEGHSQVFSSKAVVDQKPVAEFSVTPETGEPGKEFTFDASASKDNGTLAYRWDFNNDGTWDHPKTGYTTAAVTKQAIEEPYTGDALLEVRDNLKQRTRKKVPIKVTFPCVAKAEPPAKVNLVTKSQLSGTAEDKDGKVLEYAWDFDNDGKFDWNSKETGAVGHLFGKEGKHTVVFKAICDDGSQPTAKVDVEVFNEKPTAMAGQDLKTKLGQKVKFAGTGKDADGKINKYEWDFDGDGEFDYSSVKTGTVEYAYQKAGTYKATLRVTSKDGQTADHSISVSVK